jgi:hypothetical protein
LSSLTEYLYQEEIYQISNGIVVVLPLSWEKTPESDKTLLTKILGSVRINIDSVVIITRSQVSLSQLTSFNSGKVLVFGSAGLAEVKSYEKTELDGISVIKADNLSALTDSTKKSLWMALKQMFPA